MDNNELVEIGKKTVTKRCQRPDRAAITDPGDNRKFINHSLTLASLGKVNMKDNDAVKERVRTYFEICAEDDMKPSVAGLAVAFSMDRKCLWEYRTGAIGKSEEVRNTLKQAVSLLDLQMVDYMQNGKINPVSGIFLMKNNFGYADKQEVVVTPNMPLGEERSSDDIARDYAESVPDEP